MARVAHTLLFILCLLAGPASLSADSWNPLLPGLTVVGWDRLTPTDQTTLTTLLSRVPRGLYPALHELHIDGGGYDPQAMSQINCASGVNLYPVCAHELGHQIDVSSSIYQHAWAKALIDEAGRDSDHYLRSMFPAGFFVDNPQEFLASMLGEWLMDSQPMLARALDAWQTGNPHPLNQAILLMATMGMRLHDRMSNGALVLAYRGTIPEFWWVEPWRCGGPVTISDPTFRVTMTTDERCRVVSVGDGEGL